MNIKKVNFKKAEYCGRDVTVLAGHMAYTGTVQVLVDKIADHKKFIYKKIGDYFFHESKGFVSVYLHKPGTKDGFAGREISLNIEGEIKKFKGTLWDPTGFDDTSGLPEYRSISITDDPHVMERGYTFYSSYVTKNLYDNLCKKLKLARNPEIFCKTIK